MTRREAQAGLIIVDKPADWTSHDVVARVRRIVGTRRVGHAGTLDPAATGVLVVGVARATRLLGYLSGHDKTYRATIRLGQATTTDDAEGEITGGRSAEGVDEASLRAGLAALTGDIDQVPSSVSAIKVDGERAYRLARAGEQVVLRPRRVRVSRLDLVVVRQIVPGLLDLDVVVDCSAGTYIRALARDLGASLGVGGHLTALRRTRVGAFGLADALTLEELADRVQPVAVPLDAAVASTFPRRDVDAEEARRLGHGGRLAPGGLAGTYGVFDPSGHVVALMEDQDGAARPLVVFQPG